MPAQPGPARAIGSRLFPPWRPWCSPVAAAAAVPARRQRQCPRRRRQSRHQRRRRPRPHPRQRRHRHRHRHRHQPRSPRRLRLRCPLTSSRIPHCRPTSAPRRAPVSIRPLAAPMPTSPALWHRKRTGYAPGSTRPTSGTTRFPTQYALQTTAHRRLSSTRCARRRSRHRAGRATASTSCIPPTSGGR